MRVLLNSMSTAWERGDVGFEWRQRKCAVERSLCTLILQTVCLLGNGMGSKGMLVGLSRRDKRCLKDLHFSPPSPSSVCSTSASV